MQIRKKYASPGRRHWLRGLINHERDERKVLLAVLAHPDDETFGTGGTLALYARSGVNVHLICATRGEVGEMDPKLMRGFDSIASRREHELRCAAELLGLSGVYFLNYRDSGMPGSPDNSHPDALVAQPLEKVASEVGQFIRELKPQVVITFDPIGGYRHPDHIAIQRATVKAFEDLLLPQGDGVRIATNPRDYFSPLFHGDFLRLIVRILPILAATRASLVRMEILIWSRLPKWIFPLMRKSIFARVAEIRDDAARCHESQGGASMTSSGWIGRLRRMFMAKEMYMRAYPPVAAERKNMMTDLFASM